VFATRTVQRPNPIGLSAVRIRSVDLHRGLIALDWVDCEDGTPLLDLEPYHPCADRVESPRMPAWCARWPASIKASAAFDWGTMFPG
jgi:tRNA (Thr-GGU) A37 N-methylase